MRRPRKRSDSSLPWAARPICHTGSLTQPLGTGAVTRTWRTRASLLPWGSVATALTPPSPSGRGKVTALSVLEPCKEEERGLPTQALRERRVASALPVAAGAASPTNPTRPYSCCCQGGFARRPLSLPCAAPGRSWQFWPSSAWPTPWRGAPERRAGASLMALSGAAAARLCAPGAVLRASAHAPCGRPGPRSMSPGAWRSSFSYLLC